MVSIKDIAKECHVSVSTVSKALNNRQDISDATKKKILDAVDALGYTPNIAAQTLRTNRTYNIGVLYTDEDTNIPLTHEHFSRILQSFKVVTDKNGYDITFINPTINGKKSSFLNHSHYRNFDGVVIISANYTSPEVIDLVNSDIPTVSIDYMFDQCSSIVSDNSKGIRTLVKYAYKLGHRKIAFIHGQNTEVTMERINGFFTACRELNLDIPSDYVLESKFRDSQLCLKLVKQLISMKEKPTCILFPDDYAYIGCIPYFKDMGIHVPDDISFIGYDGIHIAQVLGITTYQQDAKSIGTLAAQKLIKQIEDSESAPEHVIVTGKLIEGNTVKNIQ